jgi:hypothetical protein
MIEWYWLPIAAIMGGSVGCFMMAIIAGGSRNDHYVRPLCPHGDSYDDCPDCRH